MRIASILLFLIVNLFAQSNTKNTDTLTVKLQQITVTATRYPEKIMEIPYAVTVIDAKQLEMKKGFGLDEAIGHIPGVLAQSRSGNQDIRIVIRGFGARGAGDRSNSGTSRGIRIMVDGIPETEPDGRTSFDMIETSSADRIEVTRSNASATWGNAAGGVVNISTIPSQEKSFLKLSGYTGSFGFDQIQLHTMARLKSGKIFFTATNTNYSGWRNHSSSYRSLFNAGITSSLDLDTDLAVFLQAATNLFHIPGPLTQKQFDSDASQANTFYLQRDERRNNRLGKIAVTIDHRFGSNNSVSTMAFASPKFLQRSERGTFRDFTRYHVGGNLIYKNKMILSNRISSQLVTGMDEAYQDGAILFYNLSVDNQRGEILRDNKREGANTFGAFIQEEVTVDDKLSMILGARYDNVTYYSESFISTGYGLNKMSFHGVTPKAGASYRVSPTQSIYANLGGGIEVPAGNETDPSSTYGQDKVILLNPLLEPIHSTTYELGTKHIFYLGEDEFLKYINYDVALYLINIKNDIIPYRGGRFYFTAGKTSRKGIELSSEFQFAHGINIRGAFTLSDNKYEEYVVDSVHYGKAGKFADYSQNKVAGIPDYFLNLNFTYQPEFANSLYLTLGMQSVGKYFVDDGNVTEVPAYSVLNFTLGTLKEIRLFDYLSMSGFFTINNLLDEKYAASAFINPDKVNNEAYFLEPGLPRNFVLGIKFIIK